jgi:hypothetical protein
LPKIARNPQFLDKEVASSRGGPRDDSSISCPIHGWADLAGQLHNPLAGCAAGYETIAVLGHSARDNAVAEPSSDSPFAVSRLAICLSQS